MTTAPTQDEERAAFEAWLRTECFQAPPDYCKDLALAAWQARATAAEGWRPIETAPRDGKQVLILFGPNCNGNGNTTFFGVWRNHDWFEASCDEYLDPTHWMPLPAAPGRDV